MKEGEIPPETEPGGGATHGSKEEKMEAAGGSTYVAVLKKPTPAERGKLNVEGKQANPYQRMNLTFIEPVLVDGKPLVELPPSVVTAGEERWKFTLIGHVLGLNPSFSDMEGFVRSKWAELGKVQVHLMGKGLFVFQLESEEARQGALERGPWSFSRRPLILRPWSVGMALEKPDVENLPIWVQYPNLPIELWTPEALSRISSQLGKPLFADRNTSEQRRLGYARVCVEIKVQSTLFEEIPVKYASGYVHYQKVQYEWVPSKCLKCKMFGHVDQGCKAVQMYVPKDNREKVEMVNTEVATTSSSKIELKISTPCEQ